MFCKKCGIEQSDDALFCASCGAAVRAADATVATTVPLQGQTPATAMQTKKKGKALIAVIAVLLVVGLAVSAVATKGFGLIQGQNKPENPVAVIYDAAKKILMSSGFDVKGKLDYDGDVYILTSGSLLFGRGFKSSVASVTISEDDDWRSIKAFITPEGFAYFDGEEPDGFDSFYLDDVEEDFRIDTDRFVQDGRIIAFSDKGGWDSESIVRQLDGLRVYISQEVVPASFRFDFGTVTTVRLLAEALDVVDGFFYDYCNSKAVWEDIIIGYSNEVQNGSVVSTFGVDSNALIRAIMDYLPQAVKAKPTLNNLLEQYIAWEWGSDSDAPPVEALVAELVEEIAWVLEDVRIPSATLTTDNQGRLETLNATCYIYRDKLTLEGTISNYNAPSLDPAEAMRQIELCKNARYY